MTGKVSTGKPQASRWRWETGGLPVAENPPGARPETQGVGAYGFAVISMRGPGGFRPVPSGWYRGSSLAPFLGRDFSFYGKYIAARIFDGGI